MSYFEKYHSNTTAGSGNQFFFSLKQGEKQTGRVFYRIENGGSFHYSLLFSGVIDSTYSDGSKSHHDLPCHKWQIHKATLGVCKAFPFSDIPATLSMNEEGQKESADLTICDLAPLTFSGRPDKQVTEGEFFYSDPVLLSVKRGEYLCLELTFSGEMIPYHEESLLPIYRSENGKWHYQKQMPLPGMIGCDHAVKGQVAFLGDSITQGIGTRPNSYLHWNAHLAEMLGSDLAFWNLGIGFGRAEDAAADGAWLYKAKQNNTVFVCFGVNDILQGRNATQIKEDLSAIVDALTHAGVKVILQTIPPFDYQGEQIQTWEDANAFIRQTLAPKAALVFDNAPILGQADAPHKTRFGGHPNEEGCAAWAKALYLATKDIL